ncbi:hypothetical protein D3C72_839570 [compost metagenome]
MRRPPARQLRTVLQARRGAERQGRGLFAEDGPEVELLPIGLGRRAAIGVERHRVVIGLDRLDSGDGSGARQHGRDAVEHQVWTERVPMDHGAGDADAPGRERDRAVRVDDELERTTGGADLRLKHRHGGRDRHIGQHVHGDGLERRHQRGLGGDRGRGADRCSSPSSREGLGRKGELRHLFQLLGVVLVVIRDGLKDRRP